MSCTFNTATQAFDAWLSRRCNEALTSEVLKNRGDAMREDRIADARPRLASFLGGVFAGAQAASDEVIAGIEVDGVDFAALAGKWLRAVAYNVPWR